MSSILCLAVMVLFVLLVNLGFPRLIKKWRAKRWVKALVIFAVSLLAAPLLGGVMQLIINESLKGRTGGFELIGVGVGAALVLILNIILYLVINLILLIVRLVTARMSKSL